MRTLLPILLLFWLFAIAGFGQNPGCPTITVSGPEKLMNPGEPMMFTANSLGTTVGTPVYSWTVSMGLITNGQGTATITVDTAALPHSEKVTATVSVKSGVSAPCTSTASGTGGLTAFVCGLPLDDYGEINWDEERARLNSLWYQLRQNPGYKLYLFVRITEDESFDATRKHAKKMMGHFLSLDRKLDPTLVTFIIYVTDTHQTIATILSKENEPPKLCDSGCIAVSGADLVKK